MSASLTLTAICGEREVLDHEALLFLRIAPYILAKSTLFWTLSALQTTVFLAGLVFVRSRFHGDSLIAPPGCGSCLL